MNLYFLLGDGDNKEEIQKEADENGDLIVGDFEDTYDNLPIKTFLGYQFYNDFCPNSNLPVAFVDDDTLVRFDRKGFKRLFIHLKSIKTTLKTV